MSVKTMFNQCEEAISEEDKALFDDRPKNLGQLSPGQNSRNLILAQRPMATQNIELKLFD